jgi:hypothetical protein
MADDRQQPDRRMADQPVALERRHRGDSSDTPKLRCPTCGEYLSRVIDTFVAGEADAPVIRRRRRCENRLCGATYATVERVVGPVASV